MEKKKFNFKKIMIVFCLCFVTLFAFIPFANLNKINFVSADEVETSYYFHSSDTYYITSVIPSNQVVPILFTGDNSYVNNVLSINISLYLSYVSDGHSSVDYYRCDYIQQWLNSSMIASGDTTTNFIIDYNKNYTFYTRHLASDNDSVSFYVYAETGFNSNIYSVTLGVSDISPMYPTGLKNYKFFNVVYFCENGASITYSFCVPSNFMYSTRTYYLIGSEDLSGNQLYSQGYQQGLIDNQQNIYTYGYNNGLTEGYNNGYNVGVNDSNQYSFYNLFGAVLDAPVRVFKDLFNFNLLGVNLLGLITGLFTLAMIILILKLILGGK